MMVPWGCRRHSDQIWGELNYTVFIMLFGLVYPPLINSKLGELPRWAFLGTLTARVKPI